MAAKPKSFTAKERALIDLIVSGPRDEETGLPLSETACVMRAGWKEGSVGKLLKKLRPEIYRRQAENAATVDKAVVKRATATRSWIEQRSMEIASMKPDDTKGTATAQVKALELLAQMGGHIVNKTADVTDEFRNKSEEELEFFSTHGYWPNQVDAGVPGATESKSSSQIPPKPGTTPN